MTEIMTKNNIENGNNYQSIINRYFGKYRDFFCLTGSKAIFLIGALAGFLLEAQRIKNPDKKGNEPFWKALHDLRLDKRRLLDLFPKIVNKLKQMQFSYANLVGEISKYLQDAGKWNLSNIELSWYFTHGLASYKYFKKEKKNGKTYE